MDSPVVKIAAQEKSLDQVKYILEMLQKCMWSKTIDHGITPSVIIQRDYNAILFTNWIARTAFASPWTRFYHLSSVIDVSLNEIKKNCICECYILEI